MIKKVAKKIFKNIDDCGLYSTETGVLFNKIGFNSISLISSDVNALDFSWNNISRKALIKKISLESKRKSNEYNKFYYSLKKFLDNKNNSLIIDYSYGDHIRESLDRGVPVWGVINWTMYFKSIKYKDDKKNDTKGISENHAVVFYGYNDFGVYVLDSRQYEEKGYKNGR